MKKIFALTLSIALILSMSASVFAAGYANDPATVTTQQAATAVTEAIKVAQTTGSTPTVSFNNVSTISASTIKAIFAKANNAVVKSNATENGSIVAQIKLTSDIAKKVTGNVDLTIAKDPANVLNAIKKNFSNTAVTAYKMPKIGTDYKAAVKVAVKNPVIYVMDSKTNKYRALSENEVKIDKNGFAHLTVSGSFTTVLISNGALKSK